MQVERNKTVIIGATPVARTVAKVLGEFIPVETISIPVHRLNVPVSESPAARRLEAYRRLIQAAPAVLLVPLHQAVAQDVVLWIHLLRNGHFLCTGEILVVVAAASLARQLAKTSLFFENAPDSRYPLGSVPGHQIVGPLVPLRVLLTAHYRPDHVYLGTWLEMMTNGFSLHQAGTIVTALESTDLSAENLRLLSRLRELLLEETTRTYARATVPNHDANKIAAIERLFHELERCNLEIQAGRCRAFDVSKTILMEIRP